MDKRALRYWIAFNRVNQMGAARINAVVNYFQGDLEKAWRAPDNLLEQIINHKGAFENFRRARQTADLDADLEMLTKFNVRVTTFIDEDYPALLRQIHNPPPVLYYKGSLSDTDGMSIGIVGTRSPTEYGLQATRAFSVGLLKAGLTIVSGLAKGIDTAAHKTAIVMNGRTFALLGHGLDQIYPKENAQLAESITRQGALISEFPIGMPPDAGNFPMRNRLISGLSLGVLVVEAGAGSGALTTARHANDQNREVFAVPGSIFNEESVGVNTLIQRGEAKLVMQVSDILSEFELNNAFENQPLPELAPEPPKSAKSDKPSKARRTETFPVMQTVPEPEFPLNESQQTVFNTLSDTPMSIDEICSATGFSAAKVTSILTVLELNGMIAASDSQAYTRNGRIP